MLESKKKAQKHWLQVKKHDLDSAVEVPKRAKRFTQ
jgi:hypothetical protein